MRRAMRPRRLRAKDGPWPSRRRRCPANRRSRRTALAQGPLRAGRQESAGFLSTARPLPSAAHVAQGDARRNRPVVAAHVDAGRRAMVLPAFERYRVRIGLDRRGRPAAADADDEQARGHVARGFGLEAVLAAGAVDAAMDLANADLAQQLDRLAVGGVENARG